MKKSLSLLLAVALVFSMFGSLALAAENPLTTQQKYDALAAKDIFAGIKGEAALDQNMTRAQFARVAALILGLEGIGNPDTKVVTEKPFTDVELGTWYVEEIAAAKEAGIVVGNPNGTFAPNSDITIQELAVMIGETLGLEPVEDAEIEGAANWAAKYIQAIQDAGLAFPTNYADKALRSDLVVAAYAAAEALNVIAPENVGIANAKATGAKVVTVTLNGPVDTAKAKVELKRNGTTQVAETNWSNDKKVATLTLDTKVIEASYTATLSGIDNLDDAKKSVEFKAENEKVASIEILTANDTLPRATNVKVEFKASNQYGEKSTLNASSFTIAAGNHTPVPVSGEQAFTLDLFTGTSKGDRVPVTIIHADSGNQANKVFTIGDEPIVSKIEVADLKDGNNKTIESVKAGDSAYIEFKAYDQYGVAVTDAATLNNAGKGVTVIIPDNDLEKDANGGNTQAFTTTSEIGDSAADLRIKAKSTASEKTITVSLYANGTGQSVQKLVKISTPKVPATVEFGNFTDTLAVGDGAKQVPLIVKDAAGNTLTAAEVAAAADKFTVYAIGGNVTLTNDLTTTNSILKSGEHKGKIAIASVDNKGTGSIVIQLKEKPDAKATLNIAVVDARKPERIAVSSAAAGKLLNGATSDVKFKTFDQYSGDNKNNNIGQYFVRVAVSKTSGADSALVNVMTPAGAITVTGTTYKDFTLNDLFDAGLTYTANGSGTGSFKVEATMYKVGSPTNTEVHKAISQIEVIDGSGTTLTYEVSVDGAVDNTIYAATKYYPTDTTAALVLANHGKLAKEIKVSAKDSNGVTVALPAGRITSITPSNPSVMGATVTTGVGHIAGFAAGTSDISVLFKTHNGYSSASLKVTVKDEVPSVASISVDKASNNATNGAAIHGAKAWASNLMNKLIVKDQYGSEYKNEAGGATDLETTYNALFGIKFFISDIKHGATSTDTVSVDPDTGVVSYVGGANDIVSFVINAIAPSGKIASTEINLN